MLLRRYCQERHDTKQNSLESKKIPPRGRKKFSRECPSKCSLEPEHAMHVDVDVDVDVVVVEYK